MNGAIGTGGVEPRLPDVVTRATEGDADAVVFLYLHHRDAVHRYVVSMLGDRCEADEVTVCVFLKLKTAIVEFDPRRMPFSAWLLRVARGVAVDHLRGGRLLEWEEVYDPRNVIALPRPAAVEPGKRRSAARR